MTEPNAGLVAALADRYRIEREVGAGGMATVYLAHDLRHGRPVAIKVLRPELAAVIGADRFLAEIKTTAQLQHAHILGLIDSGEVNGTVFYVMPFVDGESLRQRLARETQIPIPDAVRIATAVAGALDYAHRRGVIHRDIKPENILLHEGQPLIADFGIALAVTRSGDGTRITESGMSLGTPQYMSPEQAMGERTLDARTDVYALGCVLYEMLTGEPPFSGPNARAIIAKVMTVEPEPVTTLRRSVPSNVAAATMTALNKVPADRFSSTAEFAAALSNPQYVAPEVAARRAARGTPRVRGRDVAGIAAIALLAIAALIGWLRPRPSASTTASAIRFEIPVPDSVFSQQLSLSRDGTRLVWATPSGYFERRLDSLGIRRLRDGTPSTGGVRDISPAGNEVLTAGRGGFSVASLGGGPPRQLVGGGRGGASWGADGYVYFSLDLQGPTRGIARIRIEDGHVDTLVKTDALIPEMLALPNGRGLLVVLNRNGTSEIDALDLRDNSLHKLEGAGSFVQFVEPGYLIFVRGGSVMAAPFDVGTLSLTRPAAPYVNVASGVTTLAANANVLVYLPGPDQTGSGVVVRSQRGTARPLANMPDTLRFTQFVVSPDARRFAATGAPPQSPRSGQIGPQLSNVYIYEFSSGILTRLRSDERDQSPAWLPNGRELSFVRISTDTPTTSTLMRRTWDGSSPPATILQRPGGGGGRGNAVLGPVAWFPDGRHAVVRVAGRGAPGRPSPGDLMRLSLDAPAKLDTVVATEYAESAPAISPDGRVLAFTSDESGRPEVYIRPMDGGALRRVSLNGGTQPRWSHGGRELFYTNFDTLFAADIRTGADFGAGDVRTVLVARNINQGFAVLPGDTTFITPAFPTTNLLVVVTNFAGELERMFPKR